MSRIAFAKGGTAALLVAVLAASPVSTSAVPADDRRSASAADEAAGVREELALQAKKYSEAHGQTFEESLRRLERMPEVENFLRDAELAHPDRWGGGWIENGDEYEAVVTLTPGPALLDLERKAEALSVPTIIEYSASRPFAERLAELTKALPEWTKTLTWIQGVYPDVKSDVVVFVVGTKDADREGEIRETVGDTAVRIETVGGVSSDGHKGGLRLTSCTSAFTIQNWVNPAKHFVTAAHCPSPQDYKRWDPNDSTWNPSTYVGRIYNKDADIEWWNADNHVIRPRFYGGVRSGDGTLQVGPGYAAVGSHLCHQGKVTDYSCGDVNSTSYAPYYLDPDACPSMPCNPSFVRVVDNPNLNGEKGDSGGPWFSGGHLYGVYKGQSGDGNTAWFSKYSYLPSQFQLLTN